MLKVSVEFPEQRSGAEQRSVPPAPRGNLLHGMISESKLTLRSLVLAVYGV